MPDAGPLHRRVRRRPAGRGLRLGRGTHRRRPSLPFFRSSVLRLLSTPPSSRPVRRHPLSQNCHRSHSSRWSFSRIAADCITAAVAILAGTALALVLGQLRSCAAGRAASGPRSTDLSPGEADRAVPQAETVVGLDIGSSAVKAVELKAGRQVLQGRRLRRRTAAIRRHRRRRDHRRRNRGRRHPAALRDPSHQDHAKWPPRSPATP